MLDANCFWFGEALGDLELICLLSILRQGHRVRLFSYEKLQNVPAGIENPDAREVLSREELIFYRANGSPALGANRFRCRLMKKGLGLWLDTDMLLLKPIHRDDDYIFGWQGPNLINNAVLYLPPDAKITDELLKFTSQNHPIPPFYEPAHRADLERRKAAGAPVDVRDLPWGVYGPMALTYFVLRNRLQHHARPPEIFYPVHWSAIETLFSSKENDGNLIRESTIGVHLWNTYLRAKYPAGLTVEKGCFVEKFAREQLGIELKRL
jgi:hypothetical protein